MKVNGHTRRVKTISRLRDDFAEKDGKFNFKKIFNSLCIDGCIYCNGDKAYPTNDGIKQLNQLQNV